MEEIKAGQILCGGWGYEANYPEFYQVIKVAGQFATLQKLKSQFAGFCGEKVMWGGSYMTPGEPIGNLFRRKIKNGRIRINEYYSVSQWDGSLQIQYNHH